MLKVFPVPTVPDVAEMMGMAKESTVRSDARMKASDFLTGTPPT
jgi:hypothetical protein